MSSYCGFCEHVNGHETWCPNAHAEIVQSEIDTLRAELAKRDAMIDARDELLATVTAERDALSVRVATAERDRFDLLAERDALRAKVDAVPWVALPYALLVFESAAINLPEQFEVYYSALVAWYDENEPKPD